MPLKPELVNIIQTSILRYQMSGDYHVVRSIDYGNMTCKLVRTIAVKGPAIVQEGSKKSQKYSRQSLKYFLVKLNYNSIIQASVKTFARLYT